MRERLKICILGNSVALRNRPVEKYPNNKNYGAFLEDLLSYEQEVSLVNKAKGRATIRQINKELDNHINEFPDYYILNIGVCDSATRPIPYWYGEIINNTYSNSLIKSVLSSLYYRIIKPHSSFFVNLRGKRSWVSANNYKKNFEFLVSELIKDSNAKIIIMSINNTNERVESIVPGSGHNYEVYNSIMKDIADKYAQVYVDTTDMSSAEYYPDGTHYNLKGNKDIAVRLYKIISKSV